MYKHCITEQSALRQKEIENGLLQAMKTRAYEDITISELCSALNIPRKSFYRYFSSKEGALYALIDHTLMEFSEIFFPVSTTTSLQVLEQFFAFWVDHRAFLYALEKNGLGGILTQRAIEKSMHESAFTDLLVPVYASQPQEYVITFLVSGLMSLVLQWHHNHYKESPDKMAALTLQLLTDPTFAHT